MNMESESSKPEHQVLVEKEWDKFIKLNGGQKISELVGESPPFENADYLIENVVIELKEIQTEFSHSESFINKYKSLVEKLMAEDPSWTPSLLGGKGYPEWFETQAINFFRKPIGRIIKKANSQIKETKKYLNLEGHEGVLLLVIDHFRFLPPHRLVILAEDLILNSYSSINCVVYLTINSSINVPDSEIEYQIWVPIYNDVATDKLVDFIDKLGETWSHNLDKLLGPSHEESLGKVKNPEILFYSKYNK
jgi:hypothetical protein